MKSLPIAFSRSITGKLSIPLLVIFCLVIATFLLSIEYRSQQLVEKRLSSRAIELADSFAVATESNASNANFIRVVNSIGAYKDVKVLYLVDDKEQTIVAASQNRYRGKHIAQVEPNDLKVRLLQALQQKKNLLSGKDTAQSWYIYKLQTITEDKTALRRMTLLMEIDISSTEAYIRRSNLDFFFALLALLAVIGLTFYALARRHVLTPVASLMESIKQTQMQNKPVVSSYRSNDEMGVLSRVYNDLIVDSFNKQQALSAEREKSEAAAQAKSRFLAMMTHELRTPLNGVIGMSDQLDRIVIEGEGRKYLDVLRTSAKQLFSIINDTLDFSKIEADKLELDLQPMALHKNLTSVASMFEPTLADKEVTLRLDLPEQNLPLVLADEVRFRQILINLVGNAVKFTESGEVAITLTIVEQTNDSLAIRISVKDSGIGLSQQQEKLFDEFLQADSSTTRKYGGTGLGLWICRKLIEKMNGSIRVKSEVGHGAEFIVTAAFKITELDDSAPDKSPSDELPDFSGRKVLVVDDTEINRVVVCAILAPLNLAYDIAENGEQALRKQQSNDYDLIFMDCLMPVMDGFEACRQIRIQEKNQGIEQPLPIVALTANALEETRQQCEQAGMSAFLTKPVVPEVLINTLKSYLSVSNNTDA